MPRIDDLYLVATGNRHGSVETTSEELEARFGLQEGWSQKYLGMTTRRRLPAGEDVAPLAVEAVHHALSLAGWSGRDLDLLVCGSAFLDQMLPPTSSRIASGVNPDVTCFDVNATCAGFPYAVSVASAMATWDRSIERFAVCVAENTTAHADHDDPKSSIFWGDAAGAALFQRGSRPGSFEVLGAELTNDSELPEFVKVPRFGYFHHDGPRAYKSVVRLSEVVGRRVLGLVGAEGGDVKVFIGHQSGTRLLADVAQSLDISPERQWQSAPWAGNQGGAGSLTALSHGWHQNGETLEDGDLVLVACVGSGLTAGAVLLKWHA